MIAMFLRSRRARHLPENEPLIDARDLRSAAQAQIHGR